MVRFMTALAGLFALIAAPVAAQPLVLGTTPNPAPAVVFVADQQGLFEAHGVDVEVQIIATDATIPAALVSGSIALGSVTPTTLLSAVANGIDLVVLSGTTETTHDSKDVAILAGTNSGIQAAADFAGKTVAVPSLGAVLDVMLRTWLEQNGVDPESVRIVEIPLPQHPDQLKAGQIDATITVDQFAQRILGESTGILIAHPLAELPEGQMAAAVVAMRSWAEANADAVAAVQAALTEAGALGTSNPDVLRAALGKAMNLPEPIVARIALPFLDTEAKVEQLDWWFGQMQAHGMISGQVDTSALVWK